MSVSDVCSSSSSLRYTLVRLFRLSFESARQCNPVRVCSDLTTAVTDDFIPLTSEEPFAHSWCISPIPTPKLTWGHVYSGRQHACPHCHVILLTGERPGFCCGPNGKYAHSVAPLPPLPDEYDTFLNDPRLSGSSRPLNLLFSFASMETSEPFPQAVGHHAFVSIQGRVYHRVRPSHNNTAIRWILYDGFLAHLAPHRNWANVLPETWIDAVRSALIRVNPFVVALRHMAEIPREQCPMANVVIRDPGNSPEIAAIMNYHNTTVSQVDARKIVVIRHDGLNQTISATSRLWEPLAYPLFFPHATLGWGISGGNAVSFAHRDHVDDPPLERDDAVSENLNAIGNNMLFQDIAGDVSVVIVPLHCLQ